MTQVIERWTQRHKRAVAMDVINGRLTVQGAIDAYQLSVEELNAWINRIATNVPLKATIRGK